MGTLGSSVYFKIIHNVLLVNRLSAKILFKTSKRDVNLLLDNQCSYIKSSFFLQFPGRMKFHFKWNSTTFTRKTSIKKNALQFLCTTSSPMGNGHSRYSCNFSHNISIGFDNLATGFTNG